MTIFTKRSFVTIAIVCATAFHMTAQSGQGLTWAPEIKLSQLKEIGSRLLATEETATGQPLTMARRIDSIRETRSINNCSGYLSAVGSGFYAASNFDAAQEYVFVRDCYILRDLKQATVPSVNYLPTWSYELLSILPPILKWGVHDEPENNQLGWSASVSGLRGTKLSADELSAEDDNGIFELKVVARGDFNGDGLADIAVVGEVEAKEGSYHRADYYIFTRCQSNGIIALVTESASPFAVRKSPCR